MRRALAFALILAGLLSIATPAGADFPCGSSGSLQPLGYAQVTVSTTAVALPSLPTVAPLYAVVVVETNGIRWRDDGTSPTSSVGMPAGAASLPQTIPLCGTKSIQAFRMIRISADSSVSVSYYGP